MTLIKQMTSISETGFKIFAPMLKASLDADGKMRLHGVASSTVLDRQGHTITESALSDMETSASNNMTIFLNHEYKVPEDVAGSVERASIRSHPTDPSIKDLILDIVINEANPRAANAWMAIQKGTQLGLSIGAMIPDGGAHRDKKSGAYVIEHVTLLETSLVGVPANPRSWVEYAVKSLNGQSVELPLPTVEEAEEGLRVSEGTGVVMEGIEVPLGEEVETDLTAANKETEKNDRLRTPKPIPGELVVGEPIEQHELTGQNDGNPASKGKDVPVRKPKKDVEPDITAAKKPAEHQHPHAHEHDHQHEHWNGISHSHEHAHTHSHSHDDSHEHVDDKQGSEHDHSHMDSYGNNEHPHDESTKSTEPDLTLTGDGLAEHLTAFAVPYTAPVDGDGAIAASQEAPESVPENEEEVVADASDLIDSPEVEEVESALQTLEPTVLASLRTSSDVLKTITRELIDTKALLVEATAERDEAMMAAEKVVKNMAEILSSLSKTPVGRRAVVREVNDKFVSLKSVYSEEFLTLLTKKG